MFCLICDLGVGDVAPGPHGTAWHQSIAHPNTNLPVHDASSSSSTVLQATSYSSDDDSTSSPSSKSKSDSPGSERGKSLGNKRKASDEDLIDRAQDTPLRVAKSGSCFETLLKRRRIFNATQDDDDEVMLDLEMLSNSPTSPLI